MIEDQQLRVSLETAFALGDLEAHAAALVLASGFSLPSVAASPWSAAVRSLIAAPPPSSLRSPHNVAVAGVRLALGATGDDRDAFRVAAKRELAREPLPPAACLRDDERVLLGVAAGIGIAAEGLTDELTTLLQARALSVSFRQRSFDLWAESLARNERKFTTSIAERAFQLVRTFPQAREQASDADRIGAAWLAARLLDAQWFPTDAEMAELDTAVRDGVRGVRGMLLLGAEVNALDAALLLDLLSTSSLGRLGRKSALTGVLDVITRFSAAAEVLRERQRGRTSFEIADEYDVQDLFRALALPSVPDIVPEDPAPKLAGRSSRLDFTSRSARLGFEIKHVKSAARSRAVRDEILIDERTYQEHPYVDTVVAFIHDPDGHIALADRPALEADLSTPVTVAGRTVQYIARVG